MSLCCYFSSNPHSSIFLKLSNVPSLSCVPPSSLRRYTTGDLGLADGTSQERPTLRLNTNIATSISATLISIFLHSPSHFSAFFSCHTATYVATTKGVWRLSVCINTNKGQPHNQGASIGHRAQCRTNNGQFKRLY